MQTYGNSFVIVFGSTARLFSGESIDRYSREPGDIDVAFGGSISEADALYIAQTWAQNELRRFAAQIKQQDETTVARLADLRSEMDALAPVVAHSDAAHMSLRADDGFQIRTHEARQISAFLESFGLPATSRIDAIANGDDNNDWRPLPGGFGYLPGVAEARQQVFDANARMSQLRTELSELESRARIGRALDALIDSDRFDIHRERAVKSVVTLPCPKGSRPVAIVLSGDVAVSWVERDTAPAMIRALADQRASADVMAPIVFDAIMRDSQNREFNIDPNSRSMASYTGSGIVAWRNARTHVNDDVWGGITARLNERMSDLGTLVQHMIDADPDLSRMSLPAHGQCAGGAGVIMILDNGRVTYPYGCQRDESSLAELISALWHSGETRPQGPFACEQAARQS